MKSDKVESKKRKALNIVEIGDNGLVYIRLSDGKKYLLNGDGCWRCGSTASCFGNMDSNELEVICEFDFFDEVRSLFLCLLQDRVVKLADWLGVRIPGETYILIEKLVDALAGVVGLVNLKNLTHNFF